MPAVFVFVLATTLVETFRMDTSAPTTMLPEESFTVPVTVARSPCEFAITANRTDTKQTRFTEPSDLNIFPPPWFQKWRPNYILISRSRLGPFLSHAR